MKAVFNGATTTRAGTALAEKPEGVLLFDGACGTSIQRLSLPPEVWGAYEGCNEYLNLAAPEAIVGLHRAFVEAGAQVIETNTFGANRVVLAEYGLEDQVVAINRAAVHHARAAAAAGAGVRVCGSLGPGTKLPLLDQIAVETVAAAYDEQATALIEAGVDLLLLETCQDLLHIKTALLACFDACERLGRSVPVMVSVTVETTGTLLTGADLAAVIATLEPYPLFALGLNCATGPAEMAEHLAAASRNWPGRLSVMPNAGLPQLVDGRTVYPLEPAAFAAAVRHFVEAYGVSIVGGCCGTTPAHIRALAEALRTCTPAARQVERRPRAASAYQAVELQPDIPPFLIGERLNANGSKIFRDRLLADDLPGAVQLGAAQEAQGAMALDLCAAYAGRNERADLTALARLLRTTVKAPLMIDSTSPDCLAATLPLLPGRCLINSINLEDGGANLDRICRLARRHGAAVVALTIGPRGMAMTAADKLATARDIHARAVGVHGLRPSDLLFDPLTFTIGSGDATLCNSAVETLNAIRAIKRELPGVLTSLGVSNISFGLSPASRRVLNSVFLHEAVAAGLDAAIIDVAKIDPLHAIDAATRDLCLNLIYNRPAADGTPPLTAFLNFFSGRTGAAAPAEGAEARDLPPERRLADKIVAGTREGIEELLDILLRRYSPNAIINVLLVPAMREVGRLFASGELLLPFVLQSAEAMRASVSYLERFMDKSTQRAGLSILLATVQGDVHDIGKNLVDIILTNNGYTVHNLGIKVPAATIIEQARARQVDAIGLSGLLVKSALVMQENMSLFREAGLTQPVLLGGAALTPDFVARDCVPHYPAPVVYCADAFAGLKALREHEAGTLQATRVTPRADATTSKPTPPTAQLDRANPVPQPPFLGSRHVTAIPLERILPYMNESALFRGRWGYRRGKASAADYDALLRSRVVPLYQAILARVRDERLICASAAYGYFRACADGDTLRVTEGDAVHVFSFPRQAFAPHLCIADFFKSEAEGGDIAAFMIVTIGDAINRAISELHAADRYHDYLMLHGFSVELTDALAEYWHETMRNELGIGRVVPRDSTGYATQDYQGSRFGFGYPACPDLEAHRPLFALLRPEAIGVTLGETMQMVPEQTTSALIAHHPQAKYFAV